VKRDAHGAVAASPDGRTNEASDVLLGLADRAVAWWAMKRPLRWSVVDHVSNPTVNCNGEEEKELARTVARWYALQHGAEAKASGGPAPCRDPRGHEWERTGTLHRATVPSDDGEARCVCIYCGASGDA
jgi:hypothetical protein